jgi:hypothetical protein
MKAPVAAPVVTAEPRVAAPVRAREPARLAVGTEGNAFEREADRIADGVLSRRAGPFAATMRPGGAPRTSGYAPASVGEALAEAGSPLEPELRRLMESRFGHDFSAVRIHCDASADRSTHELGTEAYAAGPDIVFRRGRYAPETFAGRHVLAHELAHVVQHRSNATLAGAAPIVMRYGRTVGGFFANLFQSWDYSKDTLDAYLQVLATTNHIEDDDDSDDKARQIVAEWKDDKAHYQLTPQVKVSLVREMLSGVVLGSDQDGILDLLEGTGNGELSEMFSAGPKPLTYYEIHKEFGVRKKRLELFEQRVLRTLDKLKPPAAGSKSAQDMLADAEDKYGIAFTELFVSFRIAPGDLYSSFAVNLTVPKSGTNVSVSLTRERIKVTLDPALVVDVAWPLSNAELKGVSFVFAGLKPKIEIEGGAAFISAKAQGEVDKYLQGLIAGTRFAEPGYDPSRDAQIISEVLDDSLIGDVNRVKYNFEKNSTPSEGDSKLAQSISAPSIVLNLIHTKGIAAPTAVWGVMIPPGTPFQLRVDLEATGSELMQKDAKLRRLVITSGGVFAYKGNRKIAGLTEIEMGPNFDVKIKGIKAYVDLKALLQEEYPGKISDTVAGALKAFDTAVDLFNALARAAGGAAMPPSDSALGVATWLSEGVVGSAVQSMLRSSWNDIKRGLGVTDAQIERFFGIGDKEDTP